MQRRNKGKAIILGGVSATVLLFAVLTASHEQLFERLDARFAGRQIVDMEAGRFTDHVMVYEDLFVQKRYSPLLGYEFFNAPGNYGGGVFGDRNLHADAAVITHASGLIGLLLYFLMVLKTFRMSWKCCSDYADRYIWIFCLLAFVIFSITGRITNTGYAILLFTLLLLPLSNTVSSRWEK